MSPIQEDEVVWHAINQARASYTWKGYIAMLDYYLRNAFERAAEKKE